MLCVVVSSLQGRGAEYRLPTEQDIATVLKAQNSLQSLKETNDASLSIVPDEPTPAGGGSGAGRAFSQRSYGMDSFGELFTTRQKLLLARLALLVSKAGDLAAREAHDPVFGTALGAMLSMALGKLADFSSSLCTWRITRTCVRGTFARQVLPITWDFGEMNPFAGSAGDWEEACRYVVMLVDHLAAVHLPSGRAEMVSATEQYLPDDSADALITDPPYYDAVPYADLSDYFYVWHKRSLAHARVDLLTRAVSPKPDEIIVDPASKTRDGRPKDAAFYESGMRSAMRQGVRVLRPNGVGVIVFAHKSTAGWEALLQGVVDAGWVITASWPIDTERPGRLRAQESAALASSVHLVCRPREDPDGSLRAGDLGEWRDVLDELPRRIREWMPRLDREGISGADAIFACLGPALEVFSRYSRVERADGTTVTLRAYLEQVWAAVAKEALALVFEGADASGLEADARLTSMWLWTLRPSPNGQSPAAPDAESDGETEADTDADSEKDEAPAAGSAKAGFLLEFDAARKIAQGLGAHLETLGTVVEVKGQVARLLPITERQHFLFDQAKPGANLAASTGPTASATKAGKGRKGRKPAKGQQAFGEGDDGSLTAQPVPAAGADRATTAGPAEDMAYTPGTTTLDQVHQAMILFGRGRSEALARFVKEEGAGADPRFWRLAQSLSALYPSGSDEKRWVDGVLARKKGLGF
jgi:hypothetical protein